MVKKIKEKSDEKIIIFSFFSSFLEMFQKYLEKEDIGAEIITGKDSIKKRYKKIDGFKESTTKNVLLINYQVGSEGINLTEATNVFFIEPWWSSYLMNQALARVHRIGQDKEVNVYYFSYKNSIETQIYKMCNDKQTCYQRMRDDKSVKKQSYCSSEILRTMIKLKRGATRDTIPMGLEDAINQQGGGFLEAL